MLAQYENAIINKVLWRLRVLFIYVHSFEATQASTLFNAAGRALISVPRHRHIRATTALAAYLLRHVADQLAGFHAVSQIMVTPATRLTLSSAVVANTMMAEPN